MKKNKIILVVLLLLIGFSAGWLVQRRSFAQKAFGSEVQYGVVMPEYAFAELLAAAPSERARNAALYYVVAEGMKNHHVIQDKLLQIYGNQSLTSMEPIVAIALSRYHLINYRNAENPSVRAEAVFASRYWQNDNKERVLEMFLDDESPVVVERARTELDRMHRNHVMAAVKEGPAVCSVTP